VQLLLHEGGRASIHSQPAGAAPADGWTLHASAEIGPAGPGETVDIESIRARCREPRDPGEAYAALEAAGLSYGPLFRGLRELHRGDGEALGRVALPGDADLDGHGLHPALLDAALQAALLGRGADLGGEPWLPFEMGRVVVRQHGRSTAWVHARLAAESSLEQSVADVVLADESGAVVAELGGLRARRARAALFGRSPAPADAFHQIEWQEAPLADGPAPPGRCALVSDDDEAAAAFLAALGDAAPLCRRASAEELAAALPADDVVCLWSGGEDADSAVRAATAALAVVHRLVGARAPGESTGPAAPRLWWVTRGAVAAEEGEAPVPSMAAVWGLGRTLLQEHPELDGALLDAGSAAAAAAAFRRERAAGGGESQVAWRGPRRRVARVVRAPARAGEASRPAPAGTVLVTGGLGGLGREVARWLAESGWPHLLLVGRRGMDTPGAGELVAELEAAGARVTVRALDVADRAALAGALAAIPPELPLRGVIHAAAALDDGMLVDQTPERFERVMAPKVRGAWNLHVLTEGAGLDCFVLFSSLSGTVGSPGQAGYTAANAYLDALAARRRARGLPALSLAWGPWSQVGAAAALAEGHRVRLAARGFAALSPAQGLALLARAMERPEPALAVVRLDLASLRRGLGEPVPALWRALVPPRAQADAGLEADGGLAELLPERRAEAMTRLVREEVARVLSLGSADRAAPDTPLRDLGLDSLMAVELRNRLRQRTGAALSARWPSTTRPRRRSRRTSCRSSAWARRARGRSAPGCAATSRSPSSGSAAAIRAGSPIRTRSGACSTAASTPSPRCRATAGTSTRSTIRTRRCAAPSPPGGAASCRTSIGSTRPSSASRRARPRSWTRSSASCWRPGGRRSSTPGSCRPRWRGAMPASSSASSTTTTSRWSAGSRRWTATSAPATPAAWRPGG
jgi:acyl carrier protein